MENLPVKTSTDTIAIPAPAMFHECGFEKYTLIQDKHKNWTNLLSSTKTRFPNITASLIVALRRDMILLQYSVFFTSSVLLN